MISSHLKFRRCSPDVMVRYRALSNRLVLLGYYDATTAVAVPYSRHHDLIVLEWRGNVGPAGAHRAVSLVVGPTAVRFSIMTGYEHSFSTIHDLPEAEWLDRALELLAPFRRPVVSA